MIFTHYDVNSCISYFQTLFTVSVCCPDSVWPLREGNSYLTVL